MSFISGKINTARRWNLFLSCPQRGLERERSLIDGSKRRINCSNSALMMIRLGIKIRSFFFFSYQKWKVKMAHTSKNPTNNRCSDEEFDLTNDQWVRYTFFWVGNNESSIEALIWLAGRGGGIQFNSNWLAFWKWKTFLFFKMLIWHVVSTYVISKERERGGRGERERNRLGFLAELIRIYPIGMLFMTLRGYLE